MGAIYGLCTMDIDCAVSTDPVYQWKVFIPYCDEETIEDIYKHMYVFERWLIDRGYR